MFLASNQGYFDPYLIVDRGLQGILCGRILKTKIRYDFLHSLGHFRTLECLTNAFSTSALGSETALLNCLIDGGTYACSDLARTLVDGCLVESSNSRGSAVCHIQCGHLHLFPNWVLAEGVSNFVWMNHVILRNAADRAVFPYWSIP